MREDFFGKPPSLGRHAGRVLYQAPRPDSKTLRSFPE
jgi:hypothetical protein